MQHFKFFQLLVISLLSFTSYAQIPIKIANPYNVPVLFLASDSVPMVTVHVGFKAGSAMDGELFGLSALTSSLLTKGYANLNTQEVANLIADTGAIIDASTSRDMLDLAINSLTEPMAYKNAMQIFTAILSKPSFSNANLEQQKKQQQAVLRFDKESPNAVAINDFFQSLYLTHPYAHPINGTAKTIQKITRKDVVSFYERYLVRENAVIVIVGKISVNEAKKLANDILSKLKKGKKAPNIPLAKPLTKPFSKHIDFKATQTTFYLGQLGITHHNKNYFPLMVGNYILGSGDLNSRLSLVLREKNGLTYGVSSEFLPMPGIGPFYIHFATKNRAANEALELTNQVVKDFITKGPTEDELNKAKAYLVGSFPLALASNTSIAGKLLKIAFYDLPYDFLATYVQNLQAVTAEEVKIAMQATLRASNMLTVEVGP
ncbi:MAG: hypothetical protein A3F18_00775 [Legionellales bacterium RIFCSPHIGHO2_12_FULL_37_14]|nr:MAG: hypothetical protein A3F18_00775 [Legionellales bacterium RIFCSPHIGHO2_12_FULL_37_14]